MSEPRPIRQFNSETTGDADVQQVEVAVIGGTEIKLPLELDAFDE